FQGHAHAERAARGEPQFECLELPLAADEEHRGTAVLAGDRSAGGAGAARKSYVDGLHERVTAPADRPDPALLGPIVAERLPDLLERAGQRRLPDRDVGPDRIEDGSLRYDPLAVLEQIEQEPQRRR